MNSWTLSIDATAGGGTCDPIEEQRMTHIAECSEGSMESTQLERSAALARARTYARSCSVKVPARAAKPTLGFESTVDYSLGPVRPQTVHLSPLQLAEVTGENKATVN